jgi:hypothetical protein
LVLLSPLVVEIVEMAPAAPFARSCCCSTSCTRARIACTQASIGIAVKVGRATCIPNTSNPCTTRTTVARSAEVS